MSVPTVESVPNSPRGSTEESDHEPKISHAHDGRVYAHIERCDLAIKACVVAGLVALALSIVLLGLGLARYVEPLPSLYAFSGCIGSLILIACLHCCRNKYATDNGIDIKEYDKEIFPPPEKKPKEEKKK